MIDHVASGFWVLLATACTLTLWRVYCPQTCTRWEGTLGLVAISVAFSLETRVSGSSVPPGTSVAWQRITTALFVWVAGIRWLVMLGQQKGDAALRTRAYHRAALYLLAICGGVLATASDELATVWVGLLLYGVASRLAEDRRLALQWLSGTVVMLLGIALLHICMGTTTLGKVGHALWTLAGPPPPLVSAGVAFTIAGIALMMDLATPSEEEAAHAPTSMMLGHLALARCCLLGFGGLWLAWSRALLILGALAIVWGWAASRRVKGIIARYQALGLSQRGIALVLLALAVRIGSAKVLPLSLWLAGVIAYALSQTGLMATLQEIIACDESNPDDVIDGLASRQPLVGLSLLAQLASLAALPPTLGFAARLRTIAVAYGEHGDAPWLAIALLLATLLIGIAYLIDLARVVRGSSKHGCEVSLSPAGWAVASITALGALVLGIVPLVERLAANLAAG